MDKNATRLVVAVMVGVLGFVLFLLGPLLGASSTDPDAALAGVCIGGIVMLAALVIGLLALISLIREIPSEGALRYPPPQYHYPYQQPPPHVRVYQGQYGSYPPPEDPYTRERPPPGY